LAAIHEAGGLTMVLTAGSGQGMTENAIDYDGPTDVFGNPVRNASAICSAIERSEVSTISV
jgi:hypothetical protein